MKERVAIALGMVAIAAGVAAALVLLLRDSGSEPTRAEYLAQADDICRRYERRLLEIPAPSTTNPALVEQQLRRVVPLVTARLREIRALETPSAMRVQVDRMLAAQEQAVEALRRTLAAARRRNVAQMARAFGAFLALGEQARRQSEAVGITC